MLGSRMVSHIIKLFAFIAFCSASLVASSGWAAKPLNAQELEDYCSQYQAAPMGTEGRVCIAYITGFLDGAIATDARVAENVMGEVDQPETFSERAMRTRIRSRLHDYGPSVYAEFCVGEPVPVSDVVKFVVQEFGEHENLSDMSAHAIVYASLRRHYPCHLAKD
jgi:hypothetical protein